MNPDRTPDRKPDLQSPAHSPEIIDVSVVDAEVAAGSEPVADVWDMNEVATKPPVAPPHPHSIDETPPDRADTPPSEEDNWAVLLNEISQEISQEIEPEPQLEPIAPAIGSPVAGDNVRFAPLLRAEAQIQAEITRLETIQAQLQQQIAATQTNFSHIIQTAIEDLEQRRQKLQISVEQLERRRERITAEINKSFAGGSQDIAIRLQGFKDYLVGSLQDLVVIAEEIEFPQPPPAQIRLQTPLPSTPTNIPPARNQTPQFAEPTFKATASKVRGAIDRYRNAPDYYAPAWQLRRTLEAVHADKVSDWFFTKDGRGAVRTMGSRLQNILVAAAAVSALRELYGDYLRTLVLANLPERLGDWRRGFQDCLGLAKTDFGGNGGIILFEDPEALIQKVDRIVANKEMPLIIIDNSEGQISLSILQYPLWLAFAPDPNQQLDDYREYR